jgi:RimJ/RimL family protein N-acetyltransferase
VLQPLRATDVERDFEAVMASQEALRERTGGRWPRPGFTLAENLADLHEHEDDFAAHRGFTYTVLDPDETHCLGCVYIYPSVQEGSQATEGTDKAVVWFWVRPECVEADLDQRLLAALVPWLREDFGLSRVLFRVSANDARQLALMREAGLQEADRCLQESLETARFEV